MTKIKLTDSQKIREIKRLAELIDKKIHFFRIIKEHVNKK